MNLNFVLRTINFFPFTQLYISKFNSNSGCLILFYESSTVVPLAKGKTYNYKLLVSY